MEFKLPINRLANILFKFNKIQSKKSNIILINSPQYKEGINYKFKTYNYPEVIAIDNEMRKVSIFFLAICYLLSRLVLLSPDAIEKKSKRLIFFQERFASITRVSNIVVAVSTDAVDKFMKSGNPAGVLASFLILKQDHRIFFQSCYSGEKILCRPLEEPDAV